MGVLKDYQLKTSVVGQFINISNIFDLVQLLGGNIRNWEQFNAINLDLTNQVENNNMTGPIQSHSIQNEDFVIETVDTIIP